MNMSMDTRMHGECCRRSEQGSDALPLLFLGNCARFPAAPQSFLAFRSVIGPSPKITWLRLAAERTIASSALCMRLYMP
jgi:hypothetical protein